jgi:hypothetical protein
VHGMQMVKGRSLSFANHSAQRVERLRPSV